MLRSWLLSKRLRRLLTEGIFLACFIGIIYWLVSNVVDNVQMLGGTISFDFLGHAAGFPIPESWLHYTLSDSYLYAYFVGLLNTLSVAFLVMVLATILGTFLALGRMVKNTLINSICLVYLELLRNTPVPVQLLFWYTGITTLLPRPHEPYNPVTGLYASIRGFFIPLIQVDSQPGLLLLSTVLAAAVALLSYYVGKKYFSNCRFISIFVIAIIVFVSAFAISIKLSGTSISFNFPEFTGRRVKGGTTLSPELIVLILALTIYSAALIGEIIRSGIEAVHKGQSEASYALGIPKATAFFRIIIPQALPVIIPPMTNQYISIIKYTTLAMVIGYNDVSFVIAAIIDQTGKAVEGVIILMLTFFVLNFTVSIIMGFFNSRLINRVR